MSTRFFDLCSDVLDAVVAHYATEAVALPDRQYVAAGPPALDCDLLAVWLERVAPVEGDPLAEVPLPHRARAGASLRAVTLVVTVARCTPAVPDAEGASIVLPTVAEEETASAAVYRDAALVSSAVNAATLSDTIPGCDDVSPIDWRILGPEGGIVAGEWRFAVVAV